MLKTIPVLLALAIAIPSGTTANDDPTRRSFGESQTGFSGSWLYFTPDGEASTAAGYVFSGMSADEPGSRTAVSIQCYEEADDFAFATSWDSPLFPMPMSGSQNRSAKLVIYSIDQKNEMALFQHDFVNGQTFSKGEHVLNMIRRMRAGLNMKISPVIGPNMLRGDSLQVNLHGLSKALRLACGWHHNYWTVLQPVSDRGEIKFSSNDR